MKVYRATVSDDIDVTKKGGISVNIPELNTVVEVAYMSPIMNADAGFFAPPTPKSEVLIMHLDTDTGSKEGGYYYLGSLPHRRLIADLVDPTNFEGDFFSNIMGSENTIYFPELINHKSLGAPDDHPPNIPNEWMDAYVNGITPSKMGMLDRGRCGIVMSRQKKGGDGAWMNLRTRIQSGAGKVVDLMDTPAQDRILISTGKDKNGMEDSITLGGRMDSPGADTTNLQSGEFRVDSRGPSTIVSRERGVSIRTESEGLNIDIINNSNGWMSPTPKGRRITAIGGGNAIPVFEEEIVEGVGFTNPDGTVTHRIFNTDAGDELRESNILPQAKLYGVGQAHPDALPPGSGGNPLEKGNEDWGCVNIKSDWNNINLEAMGEDSVIHINAPGNLTKIVVTTGGTVDIVATGKISLTSGVKIELNAPHVDINSLVRVDLD